jgi:hypothetical protein
MAIVVWPLLVALVGAGLWGFTTGKSQEAGRILFAIGAFWLVYLLTGKTFRLP